MANPVTIQLNFIANTSVLANISNRLGVVSNRVNNVSAGFTRVSSNVKNVASNVNHLGERIENLQGKSNVLDGFFGKIGRMGMGFVGVVQSIGIVTSKLKEFSDASRAQQETEAKLAQVMRNTMGASAAEVQSIKDLAAAQQQLGVIGDEVQLAGAQELGTYLSKADSLRKLMPVMNDMLAQQYGLNASQEQAVQIASMMGKVMDGQVGALSRYGYKFDEAQEKILKYGTEEQRAATLADVVSQSVGGMNAALAATPEGQLKQASNRLGDLKEQVGNLFTQAKTALAPIAASALTLAERVMPLLTKALQPAIAAAGQIAQRIGQALPDIMSIFEPVRLVFDSLSDNAARFAAMLQPFVATIRDHVLPALKNVMGVVSRIISKVVNFLANSAIVQDFFAGFAKGLGWLWDAVSWLFTQVENFFNNIVMPLLEAIEKVYRWATGKPAATGKAKKAATASQPQGIAPSGLPGDQPAIGGSAADGGEGKATKAAETIATGGTRNTQITINLGKMVENIVFNGALQDHAAELQQQVEEALLRTLYAAQSAAV